MIEIALCSSDLYAMPTGVCITSILENNKDCDLRIHVLSSYLSDESKEKFQKTSEKYGKEIQIHIVNMSKFDNFAFFSTRISRDTYSRFLLPEVLTNIDKVIYLDGDIVVANNLQNLWNQDIQNVYCGVVESQSNDDIRMRNREWFGNDYFNSGMLLINLELWRRDKIADKCIEFLNENSNKCKFLDQDALNLISKGHVIWLPYEYNLQEMMLLKEDELLLKREKWPILEKAIHNPVIIHYCGNIKPWHKECAHPFTNLFRKYLSISEWKDYKYTYKYDGFKDKLLRLYHNLFGTSSKGSDTYRQENSFEHD